MRTFTIAMLSLLLGISALISIGYLDSKTLQLIMAIIGCLFLVVFLLTFGIPVARYSLQSNNKETQEENIEGESK